MEKSVKRNYDKEAELQIKILEQKTREDYLSYFSQNDDNTTPIYATGARTQRRPDHPDAKASIPSNAKAILEKWMYDHRLYCYPTKLEKQALSLQTGLSVQKISNWFINSRRRTLPKVLQTEGKSANNFTISRKKKSASIASTHRSTGSIALNDDDATALGDYANQEESKIIDQNSIFYGGDFNVSTTQQNRHGCDSVLPEIIVPYIQPLSEHPKLSYRQTAQDNQRNEAEAENFSECLFQTEYKAQQAFESKSNVSELLAKHTYRGILYDQLTQSKCFYIVVNSPG